MPKVYDCFTFFNELDILELRLNELDPVVDHFVLCESPYTFRGKPKPLHFKENRDRFARFLPKIVHIVVDDMPLGGRETSRDYFKKERFQRDAIGRGLRDAAADDFVILCDVDEIPRAGVIEQIRREQRMQIYALHMRFYVYFLNVRFNLPWDKPRVARFGDIRRIQSLRSGGPSWRPKQRDPLPVLRQWKRMVFGMRPRPWVEIPEAGWHFTSMNGPASVNTKMNAYSHVRPELGSETHILKFHAARPRDLARRRRPVVVLARSHRGPAGLRAGEPGPVRRSSGLSRDPRTVSGARRGLDQALGSVSAGWTF